MSKRRLIPIVVASVFLAGAGLLLVASRHDAPCLLPRQPQMRVVPKAYDFDDNTEFFGDATRPLVRVALPLKILKALDGAVPNPEEIPQLQLNFLREDENGVTGACWVSGVRITSSKGELACGEVRGTSLRLAVGTEEEAKRLGAYGGRMLRIGQSYTVDAGGQVAKVLPLNGLSVAWEYKVEGRVLRPEFTVPEVKRGQTMEIDLVIARPESPDQARERTGKEVAISGRVTGIPEEECEDGLFPPRWFVAYFEKKDAASVGRAEAIAKNGEFRLRGRELGGDLVVGRFAEDRSDARTIALVHKLEKLPLSLPADAQWRFRSDEAVKLEVSFDRAGPGQLEGASGVAFMPWEDGRASVASRSMKDLATPGSGRVELIPGRYWVRGIYWPGTVRPPDHTILEARPLGWIEVGKDSVTSEAGPVKVRLAK